MARGPTADGSRAILISRPQNTRKLNYEFHESHEFMIGDWGIFEIRVLRGVQNLLKAQVEYL